MSTDLELEASRTGPRDPAPAPVAVPTRRRRRIDVVALLSLFVVLMICIPSRLIVEALGGAGTPATIVGLGALAWWCYGRVVPGTGLAKGYQPVRIVICIYLAVAFLTYILAFATRFTTLDEMNNADRALIALLSFTGIALIGADGIDRFDRLEVLLRRLVFLTGVLSFFGLVQFFTDFDVAEYIKLPGLVPNTGLADEIRIGFRRIAVTASHPIELGVVLAMVWPLGIYFALKAETPKARRIWWGVVILISMALAMSLSRSAVLGIFAAAVVISVPWTWRRRVNALVLLTIFLGAMRVMVPGLVGTLRGLFTGVTSDPSYKSRQIRLPVAFSFIHERPFFGRGYGTLLPDEKYHLVPMDNQLIKTTIETGVIGLAALLLLFIVGFMTARGARRRAVEPSTKDLAQTLAASILAGSLSFYTFDALAYPMVTGMISLLLGCIGALWRIVRRDPYVCT
jgi:polysaccharide biosynthesis protein PslJ